MYYCKMKNIYVVGGGAIVHYVFPFTSTLSIAKFYAFEQLATSIFDTHMRYNEINADEYH